MNVKNLVLGLGIVIVFGLTLWQGIEAFYPSPQYQDFCSNGGTYYDTYPVIQKVGPGAVNCTISPTPQQQDLCSKDGGMIVADSYDVNGCAVSFKCDMCNKEFTDAQKSHSKVVFYIALIIGIIALVVGYSILTIEPVGSALMGSGIWAFFYGTVVNWQNFSNIWRFLLLVVALIMLVWITIRLNMASKKKDFLARLGLKRR